MESTFGIGRATTLLGITVKTLQRLAREGRLILAAGTASICRRYTESQLRAFLRLPSFAAPRRLVLLKPPVWPAQNRRQLRAALENDDAAGAPDQD